MSRVAASSTVGRATARESLNIGHFVSKRAEVTPMLDAVVDVETGRRLTYGELNTLVNRTANALSSSGVGRRDRVGILAMNSTEFVATFFALAKLGAVVVPLNWRLVGSELAFIAGDAGVSTLVFGPEFVEVAADLRGRADVPIERFVSAGGADAVDLPGWAIDLPALAAQQPDVEPLVATAADDLLFIMYTSGTTGRPKGAMHTHGAVFYAVLALDNAADNHLGDRYLIALPLFHIGALGPMMTSAYAGITMVISARFDPRRAWELVESERVTSGLLVPTMLQMMLPICEEVGADRSTLRWFMTGASPVPVPLLEACVELGIGIQQVYGLTEMAGPVCALDRDAALARIGSAGKPTFHTEVRVIDDEGNDVGPGGTGQIIARGPTMMAGYWNAPEQTARTICDGWLHTGDVAEVDADGFVYIRDRLKDMIISGGENVYPAEVESVLLAHPDIVDAAVFGTPSAKWGESPVAVVVASTAALDEAAVLAFTDERLARFKQPVAVVFVESIPRNPTGKALKGELRDRFGRIER